MARAGPHCAGGFTLAEALLAAVVLAVAVAAVTVPFSAAARTEQADGRRTLAVSLAREMMEEILTKPFGDPQGSSDPGPEPGEVSRGLFDNIDDYDGYTEAPGGIESFDGEVIDVPEAVGLSRHVSATYVHVSGQNPGDDPTFIRVDVEVRYRGQPVVALSRLAYNLP